jgi:hypothetical protein
MVLVDAIARRLPGALAQGSGELESFSDELGGRLEYPHYTRPAEYRGWRVPTLLLSGDHARIEGWRRSRSAEEPDRLSHRRLPHGWRVTIDWLVTIVGAIAIVLAIKAWVVNPYRIPSSSMEPTLHCATPGSACEARFSDRVLACRFCLPLLDAEARRHRRLQDAAAAGALRRRRHVREAADRPAGRPWEERDGYVYINGKRLDEPYIKPSAATPHVRPQRSAEDTTS